MAYVIKTPNGFVAGYNSEHQTVQVAGGEYYIKHFPTPLAAQGFIDMYAGIGYGLDGPTATVEYRDKPL